MTMLSWLGIRPATFLSGAVSILAMVMLWPALVMAEEEAAPVTDPQTPTSEVQPAPPTETIPVLSGPPWELLQKGRQAYEYGDYESARQFLNSALQGNLPESSRIEAWMLLGQCNYLLRSYSASRDAFVSLLLINPDYQPDPVMVPPTIMGFFERLREEMEPQLKPRREQLAKEKAARAKKTTKKKDTPKVRIIDRTIRKNSRILNFLPFGVGQFQNGHDGKGFAIMGGEIATLGLNLASYIAIKAMAGADGKFTPDKAGTARDLRIVQYSAAGAFVALWIYGIIDGLVYFQPETPLPVTVSGSAAAPAPPREPQTDMMFTGNGVIMTF